MTHINSNIEASRESLAILGEELTKWSGVRVVTAWLALSDHTYNPEGEETPYELRDAVGTELGWEVATENLDPNGDIPWYAAYLELAAVYGVDHWPVLALIDYMDVIQRESDPEAVARELWDSVMLRYEGFCESMRRAA